MDAPKDSPAIAGGIGETFSAQSRRVQAQPMTPVPGAADGRDGRAPVAPAGAWQAELGRRLRRRPGRAILAGLLLGVMSGLLAGELMVQGPTTWTSQTVMVFDDPLGIALGGDPGELAKLGAVRYKYASLASTEAMAAPVAAQLHVPVSVVLAGASVTVPANSVLIDVVGTWSAPNFARALSTAMAQEIIRYVQGEDTTYNVPTSNRFVVSVVSPASAPAASKPSKTRAIGVGGLVFLGGFLLAFTAYQLSAGPRRRTLS